MSDVNLVLRKYRGREAAGSPTRLRETETAFDLGLEDLEGAVW